jgi:roadblock/LC7 domain-containing protein
MPRAKTDKKKANGANLGFEEKLWAAADKMRGHMDAAGYKHVERDGTKWTIQNSWPHVAKEWRSHL